MSKKQGAAHRHECAACGRGYTCSKAHTILDGGHFGLHPRCAGEVFPLLPEGGPIRISLRPPRQLPRVEPVTGATAILARALGRHDGPCALDVVAGAFRRERGSYLSDQAARLHEDFRASQRFSKDFVARLYAKELKKRGKGKWLAAAIAAMNRGKSLGLVPFSEPGTVKTHWHRLQARERRSAV